jgi:hypothetical protein
MSTEANDGDEIEQNARAMALMFLKRLGGHASRVALSVEDLSQLWQCSPGFLREVISMGCPAPNNKLCAAAVFEWLRENCAQFRSQTGLPELPAISMDPDELEIAEAWKALQTIIEYHQTRWSDVARKTAMAGIADTFNKFFSSDRPVHTLLLRRFFRELSLIPTDTKQSG